MARNESLGYILRREFVRNVSRFVIRIERKSG